MTDEIGDVKEKYLRETYLKIIEILKARKKFVKLFSVAGLGTGFTAKVMPGN